MLDNQKLNQILEILNKHTAKLDKLDNTSLAHSTMLNQHAGYLSKHDALFKRIEEKLDKQSETLNRLEKASDEHTTKFAKHDELFSKVISDLYALNRKYDSLDEKTSRMLEMYTPIDKLVGEIQEHRDERATLSHRADNHEERLVMVESKLGVTAVSRDLF